MHIIATSRSNMDGWLPNIRGWWLINFHQVRSLRKLRNSHRDAKWLCDDWFYLNFLFYSLMLHHIVVPYWPQSNISPCSDILAVTVLEQRCNGCSKKFRLRQFYQAKASLNSIAIASSSTHLDDVCINELMKALRLEITLRSNQFLLNFRFIVFPTG